MKAEFSHCLRRICRLCNKKHVVLRADDRGQPFAEDGMILHAKDANWLSVGHGNAGAVNSNPSTAFKAKDFDLMTQSQDTGPVWR
jgi:hypothetical protein